MLSEASFAMRDHLIDERRGVSIDEYGALEPIRILILEFDTTTEASTQLNAQRPLQGLTGGLSRHIVIAVVVAVDE